MDNVWIKCFGLQRSGTNYLIDFAERHFEGLRVYHNRGRWKHDSPQVVEGAHGYLIVTKGPFAWVASMRRYSRAPTTELYSLCSMWNEYARAIIDFDGPRCARIDYLEALRREAELGPYLARVWGLAAPGPTQVEAHTYWRNGDDTPPGERTRAEIFDRSYYLGRRYLEELGPADVDGISRLIDWDLSVKLRLISGPAWSVA